MGIVERKKTFAKLPIMQAMAKVKCGFELETQAVDGMSFDELKGEPEFNQDAFDEAVNENTERVICDSNAIRELRKLYNARNGNHVYVRIGRLDLSSSTDMGKSLIELYKMYRTKMRTQIVPALSSSFSLYASEARMSIQEMANKCSEFNLDQFTDSVAEYWNDELERENYYSDPDESDELNLNVPEGLIAKHDGSVEGPEFIVEGNGTDAPDFSILLKKLLKRFKLKVDVGCSFHIHLSVPGIAHTYGPMLQCHMMEYLLLNVSKVPKCVRDRWKSDVGYFKPQIDQDKYTFVHFHQSLRTWEFRCFGNVNTVKDGMKCLKLAVEALQFAYKVSLGLEKSLFSNVEDWSENLFSDVIRQGMSLSETAKKSRAKNKKAIREAA